MALKAGLVNNPTNDDEGRLYREIGRSKPAPQGICVVNSAGKVLDWALMFDDDQSVLAFLDHTLNRFAKYPDAMRPFPAERFMNFPSQKLDDSQDSGFVPPTIARHADGDLCPAKPRIASGTIVSLVFGRALDSEGKPVADTASQEHYIEDRFTVPVTMQEELAEQLANAGDARFRLADDLARLLVTHAFLGQLDVNPLGGVAGGPGAVNQLSECEFWAQKAEPGRNEPVLLSIEGKSDAAGMSGEGRGGAGRSDDGRLWRHDVKLTWRGFIEMKGDRMARMLVVANGSERLKWGNQFQELKGQADVTQLPGGHAIDLDCAVRYGVIGEPVPAEDAVAADEIEVGNNGAPFPGEVQRHLAEVLGGQFLIFRDQVQVELKLSDDQRRKLMAHFGRHVQPTMQLFEKIKDLGPEERERDLQAYRRKAEEKLSAQLKGVLDAGQQARMFQLQLQQAGAFALLGQNEAFLKLKITDKQRMKFMEVVQAMQEKIQTVIRESQPGAMPDEIRAKVMKIREEHEGKIEAILTSEQNAQWKELLGKPFDFMD